MKYQDGKRMSKFLALVAACAILLSGSSAGAMACERHSEVVANRMSREETLELQRIVNEGHQPWRRNAESVAAEELSRLILERDGYQLDPAKFRLQEESLSATEAVFTWTAGTGRTAYRMTVRRNKWLLPLAQKWDATIWVAAQTEITTMR